MLGLRLVPGVEQHMLVLPLGIVDHAKASGVNSTVREIGLALGTAVLTAIFLGAGGELVPDLYVEAARPAVFVGGIVLVISAIAALLVTHSALPAGSFSNWPTPLPRWVASPQA